MTIVAVAFGAGAVVFGIAVGSTIVRVWRDVKEHRRQLEELTRFDDEDDWYR